MTQVLFTVVRGMSHSGGASIKSYISTYQVEAISNVRDATVYLHAIRAP